MRTKIVAGNWKMNKSIQDTQQFIDDFKSKLDVESKEIIIVLAVPYTHIYVASNLSNDQFSISAQDCSRHESGAYTGEVSASMLSSAGASYVILGHSERRSYHNESNEAIADKINRCLDQSMSVIFCCGEQLEQRMANSHFEIVRQQISESVFHLSESQIRSLIIAYEPVWAIGTGKTATSDQAQEMHHFIRCIISEKYGQHIAQNLPIIYGGSCKPSNAKELFSKLDVDGGLIGGASLNIDDFITIIESA